MYLMYAYNICIYKETRRYFGIHRNNEQVDHDKQLYWKHKKMMALREPYQQNIKLFTKFQKTSSFSD